MPGQHHDHIASISPPPRASRPQVQVAGSPVYITDEKLGKGGFGIVYLGKRENKARAGKGALEV